MKTHIRLSASAALLGTAAFAAGAVQAQVFTTDVIVQGSLCVGFDCVSGESFGSDTIKLKENNLRIFFDDTSSSSGFPNTDWRITINDSANGGASFFSVDDASNARVPFKIEAATPSNTLYLDSSGGVGFGTSTPAVELHVANGDSPTLRLEQNGSAGFTAQTWDVAGNEANFFVRDVTNGSQLPFKIIPGADTNALVVGANNNVGIGAGTAPSTALHVKRSDGTAAVLIEETNATNAGRQLLRLVNNGNPQISLRNAFNNNEWEIGAGLNLVVKSLTAGTQPLTLASNGNLTITGTLTTGSSTVYPDYVFEDDYRLMPLSELDAYIALNGHLPKIPKAEEVARTGINITEMQIALLEKVEELTLYTLQQERSISALEARLLQIEN